jgi:iron complex outermembrane receptor protein
MFTSGAASIPFGTVSPAEQLNPDAILVTYRNFGDITFYGADIALSYNINQNWNVGGTYSYVSKNFFDKEEENEVHDVYLNAPKHKVGFNVKYSNPTYNLIAQARLRYVDSFEMVSPFVGTTVPSYEILDFNIGMDLVPNTRLTLTIQNALDKEHIEFVGAPKIGRLAILKVTQSF